MQAREHVLFAHHLAVDERHVILVVAVVPERDDLEAAEAARQLGHGFHAHADVVRAEAFAIMVPVALDQRGVIRDARELAARRLRHAPTLARPASARRGVHPSSSHRYNVLMSPHVALRIGTAYGHTPL